MVIFYKYFRHVALLAILAEVCGLTAQQPPTPAEVMREHGVPFTIPYLRLALKNPNPEVRSIAAGVLTQQRDIDAIPLISAAMDRETVPWVRINLAADLSTLEKHTGDASLLKICNDESSETTKRLMAANQLLDGDNDGCTPAVISIVGKDEPNPPTRHLALLYLRRITIAPALLLPQLRTFLLKELRDLAPGNRQYASECLSIFGDRGAVTDLQEAIAREQIGVTRARLDENLKRLQARLKCCAQTLNPKDGWPISEVYHKTARPIVPAQR